ncbi:hypothetical protein ACFL1L_05725 [Thermoplasmatota archaeon]
MNRKTTIILAGLLLTSVVFTGLSIVNGNAGPAPNSGNGVSDGSGW